MSKTTNEASSEQVRVTLSGASVRMLDDLAAMGIYGRNRAEVAGRFIDRALQDFVDTPKLSLKQSTRGPRK